MNGNDILDEMLKCNSCTDIGKTYICPTGSTVEKIDWLMENLPGIDYVKERMVNYIFSNGMAAGSDAENETLNNWLYNSVNKSGQSNYMVLQSAIGEALTYGCSGVRWFEDNLYIYKRGTFGTLVSKHDGITEIAAYFIRKDAKQIYHDIDLKDVLNYESVEQYFEEKELILLDKEEFVCLRNDTRELYGASPLLKDKQRVNLLLASYERLNYDIDYDGPGRIVLRPKDGYSGGENEASTTEVVNTSMAAQTERIEKAKLEAKRIAKEIKNSSSDAVVVISNAFDKDIERLPRVTKATEFFDWISNEGVILAQLLGMSPTLLEVGQIHGNVSVEKIIDNAMLNTIIPLREHYAIQITNIISSHIGVPKVYFDKYDLQQVQDENEVRANVSYIIQKLASADKASPNAEVKKAITDFAKYIDESIIDDNGNTKSM